MQPGKDTQQLFNCYSFMELTLIFKTMYVNGYNFVSFLHDVIVTYILLIKVVSILNRKTTSYMTV